MARRELLHHPRAATIAWHVREVEAEPAPLTLRQSGMTSKVRLSLVLAAVLAAAGCSSSQPATGGFASEVGVLGCADLVAWGTVAATEQVSERLEVTFDVDEWVIPSRGIESVTFLADDPANEVGAPPWPISDERVLVVISDHAPAARYVAVEGQQAVSQWRGAGGPRPPESECARA